MNKSEFQYKKRKDITMINRKIKKNIIIYIIFLLVFILSYIANMSSSDSQKNILFNFSVPLYLIFLGSHVKKFPKWLADLLLTLGLILVTYLFFYYNLGFHNSYWGN